MDIVAASRWAGREESVSFRFLPRQSMVPHLIVAFASNYNSLHGVHSQKHAGRHLGMGRPYRAIPEIHAARISLYAVILLAFFHSSAFADFKVYVSATGNDQNDGRSSGRPIQTLNRAHQIIARELASNAESATIHVQPGIYRDQLVRWSFSMPNHQIVIQGDPGNRPIFDGSGIGAINGRAEWLSIFPADKDRPSNIVVRGIQVQHYLEGIWMTGGGGNLIEDNRFIKIGKAYSNAVPAGRPTVSHGAILINRSRENVIRRNEFFDVTNDSAFPSNYSTYGGLHAIYVMYFSSGTVIENNVFGNIFARGVIKFRHFSNYGRVVGNRFEDDTSLLIDSYCDLHHPACKARLPIIECPSWGIEFRDNVYRRHRPSGKVRPTLQAEHHPSNDEYCKSSQFWSDNGIAPDDMLNRVQGIDRIRDVGNRVSR